MKQSKVYLAKELLASGLDVEYVKSNLSRIPNLEIVEFGSPIKPQDCDVIIYIPNPGLDIFNDYEVVLSKAPGKAISKFVEKGSWDAIDSCIVYTSTKASSRTGDVERDTPMGIVPNNFYTFDDPDSPDEFAQFDLDGEDAQECDILNYVSRQLGISDSDWMKAPRHHKPAEIYSMPPIPPEEDRASRLIPNVEKVSASSSKSSRRRLLIRRFRR